jgi:hypothetical protein
MDEGVGQRSPDILFVGTDGGERMEKRTTSGGGTSPLVFRANVVRSETECMADDDGGKCSNGSSG